MSASVTVRTTIEYLTPIDGKTGKCRFFLNWVDLDTGVNRSQVFYAIPQDYGHWP